MNHPKNHRSRTTLTSGSGNVLSLEKLGVARFDLRDPYHMALTLKWPGFFALLILAYMAINFVFALLYFEVPHSIANLPADSLADAFFFSVETLATVGYGAMVPTTLYGHLVATAEIFIGMLFTATVTGLVFVRFSRPRAKILFAARPVVTLGAGRPVLMIRIGNGRADALTDATARITVLLLETGADGQRFRRAVDLKLTRSDFPYFPLTWTLMHELDVHSPLHGLAEGTEQTDGIRMMLSITARDPSLAAQVYATRGYSGNDIAFGMRYADAVHWDGGDNSVADMRLLSTLEPDENAT